MRIPDHLSSAETEVEATMNDVRLFLDGENQELADQLDLALDWAQGELERENRDEFFVIIRITKE